MAVVRGVKTIGLVVAGVKNDAVVIAAFPNIELPLLPNADGCEAIEMFGCKGFKDEISFGAVEVVTVGE